jgi:hypothetical protein
MLLSKFTDPLPARGLLLLLYSRMRTLSYSRMRTPVNWLIPPTLALALIAAPAPFAAADDGPAARGKSPIDSRWIFSIAAISGITIQDMDAGVSSDCLLGGSGGENPDGSTTTPCSEPIFLGDREGPLRPSDNGTDTAVSPYVGGQLQIMSPTLEFVPGRPRVFASGDVIALFGADRRIAKEGNPKGVGLPEDVQGPAGTPEEALTGRGSSTNAEVQTFGVGAQLGLAFPFDVGKRRIWVKPSAGWLHYDVDITGRVVAGFKVNARPEIREIDLSASASQTLDAIGPGLEIELETGRFGPIGSSLFLAAYGYRVLGSRTTHLKDEKLCPPCPEPDDGLGPDLYTARWSWEADPWVYRCGLGFRLHWLGED